MPTSDDEPHRVVDFGNESPEWTHPLRRFKWSVGINDDARPRRGVRGDGDGCEFAGEGEIASNDLLPAADGAALFGSAVLLVVE